MGSSHYVYHLRILLVERAQTSALLYVDLQNRLHPMDINHICTKRYLSAVVAEEIKLLNYHRLRTYVFSSLIFHL